MDPAIRETNAINDILKPVGLVSKEYAGEVKPVPISTKSMILIVMTVMFMKI